MKEHKSKSHGAGMEYFNKDHWQKTVSDVDCAGGRYASEMNTAEEYKKSADALSSYVKNHRMKH